MDGQGLENAAILLMSLGEEEAAGVFKHLSPKEVQGLGETIAKMKAITRDRVDGVLQLFTDVAGSQSMLVSDTVPDDRIARIRADFVKDLTEQTVFRRSHGSAGRFPGERA